MKAFIDLLVSLIQKPPSQSEEGFLALRSLVQDTLPENLKAYAPPDFADIYFDFTHEFNKFLQYHTFNSLVGKNILALGGAFRCGKTSFLTSLLGEEIIPNAALPNTTVPAYIIKAPKNSYTIINIFGHKVELSPTELKVIREAVYMERQQCIGEVICHFLVESVRHPFEYIAFLDTPGYAQADDVAYNNHTSVQSAIAQLNAANYILWFVDASAGELSADDLLILSKLKSESNLIIILNKADLCYSAQISDLKKSIRAKLSVYNLNLLDIFAISSEDLSRYEGQLLVATLQRFNKYQYRNTFNENFARFFKRCIKFYQNRENTLQKNLQKLGYIRQRSTDNTVREEIDAIIAEQQNHLVLVLEKKNYCLEMQKVFFHKLRLAAISFGLYLPELVEDAATLKLGQDLLSVLQECRQHEDLLLKDPRAVQLFVQAKLEKLNNNFALKHLGNSLYAQYILEELFLNNIYDMRKLKFARKINNFDEYAKIFSGVVRKILRGSDNDIL